MENQKTHKEKEKEKENKKTKKKRINPTHLSNHHNGTSRPHPDRDSLKATSGLNLSLQRMAEVYTLGSTDTSWRSIGSAPFDLDLALFPTYLNGVIHWVKASDDEKKKGSVFIIGFDFEKEKLKTIGFDRGRGSMRKAVFLYAITLAWDHLDIWMMKEYADPASWTKEFLRIQGVQSVFEAIIHVPSFIPLKDAVGEDHLNVQNVKASCQYNTFEDGVVEVLPWLGGVACVAMLGKLEAIFWFTVLFASDLWSSVLRSFGVLWVFPDHITDLLSGWYNYFGKHNSMVWNLVPLCLMWTVWREGNRHTFEDEEQYMTKLLELFYGLLFDWAQVWGLTLEKSLAAFVVSLSFSQILD
uniref:F-box associated beta-propeller type 3 domain-containing protein n=1 Tax=Fagus sylvatica TaxID=28930 RepID=A0A2N9GH99_FAGSY